MGGQLGEQRRLAGAGPAEHADEALGVEDPLGSGVPPGTRARLRLPADQLGCECHTPIAPRATDKIVEAGSARHESPGERWGRRPKTGRWDGLGGRGNAEAEAEA
ncbi:hypothetical protein Lesp01_83350 [Lentzea sp. NBRC 102530]|nr:hypothetical protein Lesp01_83350 [Lentzea sp. NBRC 102530]